MSFAEKLSKIQAPRAGNKSSSRVLFADDADALTVPEFLDRYKGNIDPENATNAEIAGIVTEDDVFVAVETIKSHNGGRNPYLINGTRVVKRFTYDDFQQFKNRVIFEAGFAEHFNILILARPNLESLVTKKEPKGK